MKCRKDLQLCFGSKDLNELWFSLQPPLTCGRSSLVSTLRYLQEVGYTDTILDVKSQRVRALLGLTGDSGDKPSEKKPEPMVNGTEPSSLKDSGMVRYDLFVLCFSSCFLLAVSGWWRLFGSEHQSHTTTQTDLLVLAALDQQPCVLQAKMTVFVYGVWWLWRHQHVWKLTSSLHSLLPVNPTCPTRPLCWRPLSSSRALRQSSATRTKRRTAKDGTRPSWTWLQ